MPAAATDKFLKVGNPGTATTLSAPGYTIGNTSINVASTTNFPTDTGVIFAIDRAEVVDGEEVRIDGTYCVFVGVVTSATAIGSLSLLSGTPQDYPAGALTRVYITVSALHTNRLIDALLLNIFDQDGTMKANAVDNAAALASDVVTTAKILNANVTTAKLADGSVTDAKISTSAIYLGSTTKTSDFLTGATTSEVAITGFSLAITVPTTSRKVRVTVSVASVTNGSGTGTDTTLRLKDGSTTLLDRTFSAPNNNRTPCPSMVWEGTLTAGAHTLAVYAQNTGAFDVRYDFSSNNTGLLEALVI